VTNGFGRQPLEFRLEALMPVAAPSGTNAIVLADLAGANAPPWKRASADGVSCVIRPPSVPGETLAELAATNSARVPQNAAWARWERPFSPLKNLKAHQGLGLEVEGDGSGALLAIRLESPHHLAHGAVADRYVVLDFTGCRFISLVETESSRWSDYLWNDGKHAYHVYRETVDFGAVESIAVWLQNLPPNRETRCRVGPIQALPLANGALKNPQIKVAGQLLEFPVELSPGSWIEARAPGECVIYGAKGELLGQVVPRGQWPDLPAGEVPLEFSCSRGENPQPRARVTVFGHGQPL
jgi:hypothetical protein